MKTPNPTPSTEELVRKFHSWLGRYGKDKHADLVIISLQNLVGFDDDALRELLNDLNNEVWYIEDDDVSLYRSGPRRNARNPPGRIITVP
jgi:hypothetical protein